MLTKKNNCLEVQFIGIFIDIGPTLLIRQNFHGNFMLVIVIARLNGG